MTQDWEPVVLHKNRTKVQDRDKKAVNQALQTGAAMQTTKKAEAGSNKKAAPVVNVKKLDEAAELAALERVSTEVKQLIQKATLEKKMSQVELAKQINEQPQVVQEYD
ncbi:multiprotein-bridging factor 1c-like [Castanea sativa]|uniref:multiprotein-bridging factor 1c-like n=1 Tax=Castanea sativa TaxID=21020 RepID=UPI003F650935